MTIAVVILIILASIIVVMVIRRTRGMDYVPDKPAVADASLTIDEARSLFEDGELTTRAGFLHYDLSEAFEVDDKELGVFTGYVKPDAQHDGELIVSDDKGMLRGTITGQMASMLLCLTVAGLYAMVLSSKTMMDTGEKCAFRTYYNS